MRNLVLIPILVVFGLYLGFGVIGGSFYASDVATLKKTHGLVFNPYKAAYLLQKNRFPSLYNDRDGFEISWADAWMYGSVYFVWQFIPSVSSEEFKSK